MKTKNKGTLFKAILFRTIAIILLIAPMGVLTFVNRDVWFVHGANKVSLGFILALVFALLMLKGAFKNLDQRVMPVITLAILAVITWLLDTIVDDLFWILLCCLIGYLLYFGIDSLGGYYWRIYKEYSTEKIRATAREDFKEQKKLSEGRA